MKDEFMEEEIPEESGQQEARGKQERYVEELAGADDYWMSITDAARATRRQDITLRRWIASGDLPVRAQRVGLSRRTRQVRASDVARLTPIVDSSVVITGAEGRLDLTNIPVEQAAIKADHQQLLSEFTVLRQNLDEQKLATATALEEQRQHFQYIVDATQNSLTDQIATLAASLAQQQQDLAQVCTDLQGQIVQHAAQLQGQIEQVQESFAKQQGLFADALEAHKNEVNTHLAAHEHETAQSMQALKTRVTQTHETFLQQMAVLTTRLEIATHAWQEQQQQQLQQIQALNAHVQQQHDTLSKQITVLTTQFAERQSQQDQIYQQLLNQLARQQELLPQQLFTQLAIQQGQMRQEILSQLTQQQEQFQQLVMGQLAQQRVQLNALTEQVLPIRPPERS